MEETTSIKKKVCDFDNLYAAMQGCAARVRWKDSVAGFIKNGILNCMKLESDLNNGTYKIGAYTLLTVYEPKRREVTATRFRDRVFQRSLCDNYLTKEITQHFIYDNGACIEDKGTDFARDRFKRHIEKYVRNFGADGYLLKCDVKNFFGSADHETAKTEMRKYIRDGFAYREVCRIIDSFDEGIGLGSQISQLIMSALLNRMDHILKERCGCKFYVRYMDDFLIISNDKQKLKECLQVITEELRRLNFRLNEQKTKIVTLRQGVGFLGFKWKVSPTGKVLKSVLKSKVTHETRKLKRQARVLSPEKLKACARSTAAHMRKATCKKYVVKKYKNLCRRLLKNGTSN